MIRGRAALKAPQIAIWTALSLALGVFIFPLQGVLIERNPVFAAFVEKEDASALSLPPVVGILVAGAVEETAFRWGQRPGGLDFLYIFAARTCDRHGDLGIGQFVCG
ncbi:MAG: hypothetical protein AAGC95_05305 [Pseudomonadota bacterium]